MTSPADIPFGRGEELALLIESTLLDPRASYRSFEALLREARDYGFRCIVVPSSVVPRLSRSAREAEVKLCNVIGFPSGL
ncbi:MAG: hypothetical protein ABDH61_02680, partial [Acidilobaceae archaeon]